MEKKETSSNLFDFIPKRSVSYETINNTHVVLIRPKIRKSALKKFEKFLPKPEYKIHLDEIGSFIWLHCDEKNTVGQICELLSAQFGERVEPVPTRVAQFIGQLARNHLIVLKPPEDYS